MDLGTQLSKLDKIQSIEFELKFHMMIIWRLTLIWAHGIKDSMSLLQHSIDRTQHFTNNSLTSHSRIISFEFWNTKRRSILTLKMIWRTEFQSTRMCIVSSQEKRSLIGLITLLLRNLKTIRRCIRNLENSLINQKDTIMIEQLEKQKESLNMLFQFKNRKSIINRQHFSFDLRKEIFTNLIRELRKVLSNISIFLS